jgi:hypothetical protein
MAKEIRIVTLTPGQQAPEGCDGVGWDGGIMWEGDVGTFPEGYASEIMTVAEYGLYHISLIRQTANDNLKDATVPDDPWWRQRNASLGLCSAEETTGIEDWVAATRVESNRCETAIEAATTIEEVQAVTATWPEEG